MVCGAGPLIIHRIWFRSAVEAICNFPKFALSSARIEENEVQPLEGQLEVAFLCVTPLVARVGVRVFWSAIVSWVSFRCPF